MKTVILLVILCQVGGCLTAQDSIPAAATQIKLALLAAPDDKKEGAAIYGYSPDKGLMLLRKGTNEMICIGCRGNTNMEILKSLVIPYIIPGHRVQVSRSHNIIR